MGLSITQIRSQIGIYGYGTEQLQRDRCNRDPDGGKRKHMDASAEPAPALRGCVRTIVVLALTGAIMAGCQVQSYDADREARLETHAVSCCASLADLPFEPLFIPIWRTVLVFDEHTPWFDFPTGKSPFRAFELPKVNEPTRIKMMGIGPVDWSGSGWRFFYPQALLLDGDKRPIGGPARQGYEDGNPSIAVDFGGPDSRARYVVIFTTPALAWRTGVAVYQGTNGTALGRELLGKTGPLQEGGSFVGKVVLTFHSR